jgi:hypothetical protein
MSEIVRIIILWVSVALNIASAILSNHNFKKWRQKYQEYVELTSMLQEVLDEEGKILMKLKEQYNDNGNNDNSSSSC